MTVRPIRLFGDPVLTTPAVDVTVFDQTLRTLVGDMVETMQDAPGVGLAAPQIGVGLRVFVYDVDDEIGHVVNPHLELSEETFVEVEGCLSIPGLAYEVERSHHVVVTGVDMFGEPVRLDVDDLFARCAQHETDHLDGQLFLSRLERRDRKAAMREIRDSAWFGLATTADLPLDSRPSERV